MTPHFSGTFLVIILIVGKGNQNLRPKYKKCLCFRETFENCSGKKCTTYHLKLEIFFLFIFNILEINNEPLLMKLWKLGGCINLVKICSDLAVYIFDVCLIYVGILLLLIHLNQTPYVLLVFCVQVSVSWGRLEEIRHDLRPLGSFHFQLKHDIKDNWQ